MFQKTQDALTYVRVHGRPHLFITMTCDPKCEEIQRELFPGQKSEDREDIIARVFNQKRKTLIEFHFLTSVQLLLRSLYIYRIV